MSLAILGIATAAPPLRIAQADAASLALSFGNLPPGRTLSLATLYRKTRIRTRGSVVLESNGADGPTQRFFPAAAGEHDGGPTTAARMERYAAEAGALATAASRGALGVAGVGGADITHLVTCSCTGFANPGVDLELVESLGLPSTVARTHVGFMGCHGAFGALRVAAAFAADPRNLVLVVPVELCSLHFQYGHRADLVVANAIFADGAGAVVAAGTDHPRSAGAWRVERQWSAILADTRDDMGWNIGDHGFQMRLSPRVATILEERIGGLVEGALAEVGLGSDDIGAWAVHPGGPRILDGVRRALGLDERALEASETVLADHGNMSSATIFFILQNLLASTDATRVIAMAFGPGLTAELALLTREPADAPSRSARPPPG
jgi:predicted naringenin-chalcone synthase